MKNLSIHRISGIETYPVRHPVLRAGRPLADCYFNGDDLETTFHFGLFLNNEVVAVATFLRNQDSGITFIESEKKDSIYQLRGMAVLKELQGKQLGKKLLNHAEHFLQEKEVTTLWFNARILAVPFYEKLGYKKVGTPFEIEPIGTHYKMFKSL
ncbi:MAG: GNAT family N-acetyltransferase [Nonlabens sp.]|uniref:GNAT family N-acetyltransferase n=1 Tax=Nonlabens sp. TaxID=1888209 RepID=UPI003EF519A9